MMETGVRAFFERYETVFNRSLGGDADMDAVTTLYASEFIAASPAGVMAGKNDDQLKQAMAQGYARYREIGTKEMRLRDVRVSPLDDRHCVAHVAWTATYARTNQPDVTIDFDVHCRDPLRRAVNHQIARREQIIEVPRDIQTCFPHRLRMLCSGPMKAKALLNRDT